MRTIALGIAAFVFVCSGCGGGESGKVPTGAAGNAGNGDKMDGGPDDGGNTPIKRRDSAIQFSDGGGDAGEPIDLGAPTVEIFSPVAAEDADSDAIITSRTVTVRCRATKSLQLDASDVNLSSIKIRMVNPSDSTMPFEGVVSALETTGEFEATFNVAAFANGKLTFTCSAEDTSVPPLAGSDVLETLLDLGPSITILQPMDTSTHALTNPVLIRFEVQAAKVTDDDTSAEPKDIKLVVIGQELEAMEDADHPGVYSASVDFDDRTLFPMPPVTAEVVVTATNDRMPEAPLRRVEVNIALDSVGPTITVISPANYSIKRGRVVLEVSISDNSGVQQDTLIATVNQNDLILDDWFFNGANYIEDFDTTPIFDTLTQLTINISAADAVGNERTISHFLRLDNVAPLISLDPPPIREWYTENNVAVCSEAFDPVGSDGAANDGDLVPPAVLLRARVHERTNTTIGQNFSYVAGVNETSVILFAQKDPSIPLLIDTNDDNVCDEINNDLDFSIAPVVLSLVPLTPRGTAYFSATADFESPAHVAPGCNHSTATMPPPVLCGVTNMTRVIPQAIVGAPPSIYAFGVPSNGTTGPCEGETWLGLPSMEVGWACIAGRVEDNIGNIGVSRALRLCFSEDGVTLPEECEGAPPACDDGCLPPPDFAPNIVQARQ